MRTITFYVDEPDFHGYFDVEPATLSDHDRVWLEYMGVPESNATCYRVVDRSPITVDLDEDLNCPLHTALLRAEIGLTIIIETDDDHQWIVLDEAVSCQVRLV